MVTPETAKLADQVSERMETLHQARSDLAQFESEQREYQNRLTEEFAKRQGNVDRADAELRGALAAQRAILNEVPIRYRQAAENAASAATKYQQTEVKHAQLVHDAASAMLSRRRKDTTPVLSTEEEKALEVQVSEAATRSRAAQKKLAELQEEKVRNETLVAAEVARVRKSLKVKA